MNTSWVNGVTFKNPKGAPNSDGLDIDSCDGMRLSDCNFDVGDDCVVIKSGCDEDGRRVGKPCQNLVITNCTMLHGHGGIVLGSEGAAGIKNITVSNCVFRGTDRGIRLKSRRGRGGMTKNVVINNIVMESVQCPFVFNLFYRCGHDPATVDTTFSHDPQPIDETTPGIRNLTITNVINSDTLGAAGIFIGLAERPIEAVTLADITIELNPGERSRNPAMAYGFKPPRGQGLWGRHLSQATFSNIRISGAVGPAVEMHDSSYLNLDGCQASKLSQATAALSFTECSETVIERCWADDSVAQLSNS